MNITISSADFNLILEALRDFHHWFHTTDEDDKRKKKAILKLIDKLEKI